MLQVTFPDELEKWVESKATSNGQNASDYLISLVRESQAHDEARQSREEKLLLESLDCGEPVKPDAQWWADLEAECMAKIDAQTQK